MPDPLYGTKEFERKCLIEANLRRSMGHSLENDNILIARLYESMYEMSVMIRIASEELAKAIKEDSNEVGKSS